MSNKPIFLSLKLGVSAALCALILAACGGGGDDPVATPAPSVPAVFPAAQAPAKLSQWNAVLSNGATVSHHSAVVPYDLSSALFTDYALKMRGIYVPAGKKINYTTSGTLDFPVGTAIYKTFYFPKATGSDPANYLAVGKETRNPQGSTIDLSRYRLIETRILVLEDNGTWSGTTYVWDADQKDASLNTSGKYVEMELVSAVGAPEKFTYVVPNAQTCQKCHATESAGSGATLPIGPKARNMNKTYDYGSGVVKNQLANLNDRQLLAGFTGVAGAPANVDWTDASQKIGDRAKAYLDVNCAHCHNGKGNASQSGLKLTYEDIGSATTGLWGVCKKPLAYSGTGLPGYTYDINPGSPESSILLYRMAHTEAGQTMPVVGRQTVHTEATSMVADWIRQLTSAPSSLTVCPQ